MSKVALNLEIRLSSPGVDVNHVKDKICEAMRHDVEIKEIREIPIAFGLKALQVLLVFDDKLGSETVETRLRSIDGIGSIETNSLTLL